MILIHSNVSKFYEKQNTNMLYCFANRRSLDEKIQDLLGDCPPKPLWRDTQKSGSI